MEKYEVKAEEYELEAEDYKAEAEEYEIEVEDEIKAEEHEVEADIEVEEYEVEAIVDHFIDKETGDIFYDVKWVGYEEEGDRTWEPEDHL
jgi:chromobox protein 1